MTMKIISTTLVLASFLPTAVAQSQGTKCTNPDNTQNKATCQSADGNYYEYDFSCVTPPSNSQFFGMAASDGSGYWYYLNLQGLPDSAFGTQPANCDLPAEYSVGNVAAQASADGAHCYALGTKGSGEWYIMPSAVIGGQEYIQIQFNAYGRNMELDLYCDETANTPRYEPIGEDTTNNKYVLDIHTKWACKDYVGKGQCGGGVGPNERSTAGGALVGVTLGLAFAYFGGGYVFLRYNKMAEGNDRIPQYEFWSSLPGLAKDGFAFTKSKITGGSGTYNSV